MNQKGFALIVLILILGLIGVLGGASYFYLKGERDKNKGETLLTTTPTPTAESTTLTKTPTPTSTTKSTPKPTLKVTPSTATPTPSSGASTPKPTAIPTPTSQLTTPTSTPTPTTTSYPKATSCSSVSVSGAAYGGVVGGKDLYYLSSGGSATLTANTIPVNGLVNWKIASYSSKLPNGGNFSTNNNPITIYTAPVNTSGSDQGVEIRGDISEYPDSWLYCPPITIAIHSN